MSVTLASIWNALDEVKDPEIPPVSVVEMGIVHQVRVDGDQVTVEATPTFTGCPALDIIRRDIATRLQQLPGVSGVTVRFVLDPPWSSDRITPAGREKLKGFGIAAAPRVDDFISLEEPRPCPYCGSMRSHLENPFGPTACRSLYYCDDCRNPFEAMKPM